MLPPGAMHFATAAAEHRVIDGHPQVRAGRHQQQHDRLRDGQAELVKLPAGPGEEVMSAVMRPCSLQAAARQHAHDRAAVHPARQPGEQAAEGHEPRGGETRAERGQRLQQRSRQVQGRKHRRVPSARGGRSAPPASASRRPDHAPEPIARELRDSEGMSCGTHGLTGLVPSMQRWVRFTRGVQQGDGVAGCREMPLGRPSLRSAGVRELARGRPAVPAPLSYRLLAGVAVIGPCVDGPGSSRRCAVRRAVPRAQPVVVR
jgi:hypothetical protein